MQAAASSSARLPKAAATSMSPLSLTSTTESTRCFRNGVVIRFRNRCYSQGQIGSSRIQSFPRTPTNTLAPTSAFLTSNWTTSTMTYSTLPSSFSMKIPQPEKQKLNNLRHFASASLWDTLGNVMDGVIPSRTNPILDFVTTNNSKHEDKGSGGSKQQLPNFSNVQARHIEKASTQILQQYEQEWSALQKDLLGISSPTDSEVKDVTARYEQITLPLVILLRTSQLFQKLCGGEGDHGAKMFSTCEDVVDQLRSRMEQTDEVLALRQHNHFPESKGDNDAMGQENKSEVLSLQKRLDGLQKPFLSPAHESSMSPRKAIPLMYEILAVQRRLAELMNKKSWADFHLDKSIEDIMALHDSLESALIRYDSVDKSEDEEGVKLETGDDGFELRKYLKLDTVLDGLFLLSRNLFGVVIVEVPSNEVKGWHRDVKMYHIYNEDDKEGIGDYLGSVYLDLYKRIEKGTDRAFTCTLVDDFMFDGDDENKKPAPLLCVNCDMSPPLWDDSPAYPSMDDVEALFHEFGHVLHDVLKNANTSNKKDGGGNVITDEFLPQLMEHWLYEPSVLAKCTSHHESGESMPPSLISQLNQQRQSAKRDELRNRLFLGALELELHSAYDPKSSENDESIVAMQKRFVEKYLPQNILMKGDITPLMQIFEANAEGKRTAQHRYLIADVLAADAFQAFRKALDGGDGEEIRRLGKSLRQTILERDGGESAIFSFMRGSRGNEMQEKGNDTDPTNAKSYMQLLGLSDEED